MNAGQYEISPVSLELTRLGIRHRVYVHPGPIHSLEQAALERGQIPQQVVRSILFRLSGDKFIMALVSGPEQIPWGKLRRLLDQNRLTMASDEEVIRVTGYHPGTVSPFGLATPLRILADQRMFSNNEISLGSGLRGTAIILDPADLKKALPNLEVVEIFPE